MQKITKDVCVIYDPRIRVAHLHVYKTGQTIEVTSDIYDILETAMKKYDEKTLDASLLKFTNAIGKLNGVDV